jgi:hypothetical protein
MKSDSDTVHTILALVALALLCTGAGVAWGVGYAALVAGAVLLAGVIYARTR